MMVTKDLICEIQPLYWFIEISWRRYSGMERTHLIWKPMVSKCVLWQGNSGSIQAPAESKLGAYNDPDGRGLGMGWD